VVQAKRNPNEFEISLYRTEMGSTIITKKTEYGGSIRDGLPSLLDFAIKDP